MYRVPQDGQVTIISTFEIDRYLYKVAHASRQLRPSHLRKFGSKRQQMTLPEGLTSVEARIFYIIGCSLATIPAWLLGESAR